MSTSNAALIAAGIDPRLYMAWRCMRERCNRPAHKSWKHYGGRGIKCCARWSLFKNFETDVLTSIGPHPGDRQTLDRINTNGHYRPGNVRWASSTTQNRNRRYGAKRKLTERQAAKVRSRCGSSYAVAKQFGVSPSTIQQIRKGVAWK